MEKEITTINVSCDFLRKDTNLDFSASDDFRDWWKRCEEKEGNSLYRKEYVRVYEEWT
tara:strand:+ start:1460 stop:1633 length:174 start_codon:yes stop_codon:yes gene_type:complete